MMTIDFCANILPGLDKTCKSRIDSIRKLVAAKEAGVNLLVATPLYDPDECSVKEFLQNRQVSEDILEGIISEDLPEVVPAAMVKYSPKLTELKDVEELCFSDNMLMLSLKDVKWSEEVEKVLFFLTQGLGLEVIAADAEELLGEHAQYMISIGMKAIVDLEHVHHKKDIRHIIPYIENGFVIAIGSNRESDSPYKHLKKTMRRMDAAFDTVMLSAEKILKEIK